MNIYIVFALSLLAIFIVFFIIKRVGIFKSLFIPTEVGGIMYGGLVAVYAILLAFVVVVVWQQYQSTGDRLQNEAAKLLNVYRYSYAFPDSIGSAIREQVVDYSKSVVNDEWPALANDTYSTKTQTEYNELWDVIYGIQPTTSNEQIWQSAIVNSMGQFGEARLLRLSDVHASIPSIMWQMLLTGCVIVILFAILFKSNNQLIHLFKIVLFSILIIFNLQLVYLLDHPFKGLLKVTPEPYEHILSHYKMEHK